MKKGDLKQEEILQFLKEYIDENGFPPSYREIANGVNIKSTNSCLETWVPFSVSPSFL